MRLVVWSEGARSDYLGIIAFIAETNPVGAGRVGERIVKTAEDLGELATGHAGRVAGTHESVVVDLPYIVAYAIDCRPEGTERIVILRVIHTSRH